MNIIRRTEGATLSCIMSAPTNDTKPPINGGGNWRESVAQTFRSEEVRSIAKVSLCKKNNLCDCLSSPTSLLYQSIPRSLHHLNQAQHPQVKLCLL